MAENQLAQAQLAQTDFPDAEQVGTETMGGQTWTWHIQRVKTAENTFADEVRVYSEASDAQPVVALPLAEPEVDRE